MNKTPKSATFFIDNISVYKQKVLNWLQQFGTFCFLDNQHYESKFHQYECLVAAGVEDDIAGHDLDALNEFIAIYRWKFGHLAYSLAAHIHGFESTKPDALGFQPYYFFSPRIVLEIATDFVTIRAHQPQEIFDSINSSPAVGTNLQKTIISTKARLSKTEYISRVEGIQEHILRGDCYEVNFCQEFFAHKGIFNPYDGYNRLAALSPNPLSAFYKTSDKYLLCASPERYLKRDGSKVISQPIKGTIARSNKDATVDAALKEELRSSEKDRAENVMVVDLVRNDLTRICKEASVTVEELYGVYSYPQVHQMISTISGELRDNCSFADIIKATFPMGSMTGAPKHRVMQLIEAYEPSARGIFSGAVGYIHPNGNFDFNVVIRSIMYDALSGNLCYEVGSAITFYSDAENEWQECLLKSEAIRQVLGTL